MSIDFFKALSTRARAIPGFEFLQSQAWQDFEHRGLPTRKMESWHYTDVRPWFSGSVNSVVSSVSQTPALPTGAFQIWFRDGAVDPSKTRLPTQVELLNIKDSAREPFALQLKSEADRAAIEHGGLTDLHLALLEDGIILRVPADISIPQPLHLVVEWTSDAKSMAGAVLNWLELGRGSRLQVIEWSIGGSQRVSQQWTRAALAEDAKLSYARIQTCQPESAMIGLVTVEQDRGSEFAGAHLVRGGGLVRETWLIDHEGEGAATRLSGLALGGGKDHLDLCSVITHQVGKGVSQQRYRALLNGSSRGIFNGKIVIAKDAQEVAANQLSQSLLLSDKAESNSKPELEIYADNVKANHGATVGQLDPEHIFYLQSRGLTRGQAQHLLAEGFALSALDLFSDCEFKRILSEWINARTKSVIVEGSL